MKKIILTIILGLTISAGTSYAVGPGTQNREANTTQLENMGASKAAQVQTSTMENLRQRARIELERRLSFLIRMRNRINQTTRLSADEKLRLEREIQTQINSLKLFQAKVNADTDATTLREDAQSMISNYNIFAFFRLKIVLLASADRASAITDNLNAIYAKLQVRIEQAKTEGDDVTNLNVLLADMRVKIADAKTQYSAIVTALTPLNAQDYPGNKSTLSNARIKLNQLNDDLKAAYRNAIQIRRELGDLKINNPHATSSAI